MTVLTSVHSPIDPPIGFKSLFNSNFVSILFVSGGTNSSLGIFKGLEEGTKHSARDFKEP